MEDLRRQSFSVDVSISFITDILILGVVSVSSIIVARTLGPEGKGVYSLAIRIPALAAVLINMGINMANVYFIGKKKYPIGLIVGNAFFYSLCIGGAVTAVLIILVPFLSQHFLKDAPYAYLYLTMPLIPFLLLFANIHYIFLGFRKMLKLLAFSLAQPLFYLLVLIFFYYRSGLSVYRTIWAYIIGYAVAFIAGIYLFIKSGYFKGLAVNREIFLESLKFGSKGHLGVVAQSFNYRLDMLIVAFLLSPLEVGLYSIAVLIAEVIWYIPKSLGFVLYPKTASSDCKEANRFTPLVCRNNVFLTLIAAVILYIISGRVIPWLFTDRFLPSVAALRLLLPGVFFLSISKVLGNDLYGRGFPQYNTFASLISLVLTVILDFLLIPRFGIKGAAVATSLVYMAHAFISLYLFRKVSGIGFFETLVFRLGDLAVYKRLLNIFR